MAHARPMLPLLLGLSTALLLSPWQTSWAEPPAPAAPAAPGAAAQPAADEAAANEGAPAEKNPLANINFQEGPVEGKLENLATIKVPEGYNFVGGRAEATKFIEATENIPSGKEVGVIWPTREGSIWFLIFEFQDVGYVKDDEKDSLDAAALLKSMQEGTEAGNEERRKRGWNEIHLVGWQQPPKYNNDTHNLEWGTRVQSKEGESVNFEVRLLGRHGVMSATLIVSSKNMGDSIKELRQLLAGFSYTKAEAYSSFRPGDKVAEYGLTALIAGGTLAVAAKTGLLSKLWKFIVLAVVAMGAAVKRFFTALFGKKQASTVTAGQSSEPVTPEQKKDVENG